MTSRHPRKRTHLFLVRVWSRQAGDSGDGSELLGGKVQRVVDGEAHSFDDWQTLVELLIKMSRGKPATNKNSSGGYEHE